MSSKRLTAKTKTGSDGKMLALSVIVMMLAWNSRTGLASTDFAQVESRYFTTGHTVDVTSGGLSRLSAGYAQRWAGWLKLHRAIQASPELRTMYGRRPAREEESFARLKRQISAAQLRSQSSNVYIIHIGTHRSPQLAAKWVQSIWPSAGTKAIYKTIPKSLYFQVFTEGDVKSEPLYVLPGSSASAQRICYGMYASREDADKDAARLKKYLRIKPRILQRPLTAALSRAYAFDDFAGGVRPTGGSA